MLLYFFSVLSEDIETQQRGLVVLLSVEKGTADCLIKDQDARSFLRNLCKAMPIRWSAIHFCFPDSPCFQLLRAVLLRFVFHKDTRIRSRFHDQDLTSVQLQCRLKSFGIQTQELPISSGGVIKTKNHAQWIKTRRALDTIRCRQEYHEQQPNSRHEHHSLTDVVAPSSVLSEDHVIAHPGIHDVLFCRGGKKLHWGNIDFHHLLASRADDYVKLPSSDRIVRKQIRMDVISCTPGKFLTYQEIPLEVTNSKNNIITCCKGDRGGVWVELLDATELHNRIDAVIYEYFRRTGVKSHIHRVTTPTVLNDEAVSNKRRKL
jgi:hypothetical protein